MSAKNIAVLVGSLRAASFSKMVANAMVELAPPELKLQIVEIGDLPLYNEDLEKDTPAAWVKFRETMKTMNGVIFVTPEYNRSIPGLLKNAIDVGSRPYGQSIWNEKPGAVASVTPGGLGAFGANHHLRQAMVFLKVPMMTQPEVYISDVGSCFEKDGDLISDQLKELLVKFLTGYANWVKHFD